MHVIVLVMNTYKPYIHMDVANRVAAFHFLWQFVLNMSMLIDQYIIQ